MDGRYEDEQNKNEQGELRPNKYATERTEGIGQADVILHCSPDHVPRARLPRHLFAEGKERGDIHDLAVEIATLTRTQQRGRGLRMA